MSDKDIIYRQDAYNAVRRNTFRLTFAEEQNCEGHVAWSAEAVYSDVMEGELLELPSAQAERKYTLEEVAEILASVIGDECACNINGIDEWLPERCKYTEIAEECPHPKEKHGCWMQFLLQGGAQI